jgi:hypothetical protein
MKLYLDASKETPEPIQVDRPKFNLSILSSDVEVHGRVPDSYTLQQHELDIAHWWVLINCREVEFWKDTHLHHPTVNGNVEYHNMVFADYFSRWVRNSIFP